MQVIPAMDLKSGKCVHSYENSEHLLSVVSEEPLDVAARWIADGAKRLHLIDIDGFSAKEPVNVSAVRAIKKAFPEVIIDVVGGTLCEDHVLIWLDCGVDYVVASSRGIKSADYFEGLCAEFPGKIMLSVDLLDGQWAKSALSSRYGTELGQMATALAADGLSGLIFTNSFTSEYGEDSTSAKFLSEHITEIPEDLDMPVFLNGAVHCLKDIEGINLLKNKNIQGIVVGRAIYDDMLGYKNLQKAAD